MRANKTITLLSGLLLSTMSSFLMAGDFEGKNPILCTSVETVECVPDEDCLQGSAESLQVPNFLRFDFDKRIIKVLRPNGSIFNASISNLKNLEDRIVIQGIEDSLAWSISINHAFGEMVLTVSGHRIGFMIFGSCIKL